MTVCNGDLANGLSAPANKRGQVFKTVPFAVRSVLRKPCKVCSDRAFRKHFGVQSCERCQAFFKRNTVRSVKYKCLVGKESCEVSFKSQSKRCKRCWVKKCETTGMSRRAVRLSRRAPAKHLPIGTPHRISQISKAYARFFGIVDKKLDAQKIQPLLLSDEPMENSVASYKTAMFSQLCSLYERLIRDVVLFSRRVPGFNDLHPDDQLILLKTGFIEIWSILNSKNLCCIQDSVTISDGTQIPICEVTTVYTKEYVTSIMELSDECRSLLPSDKAILVTLALLNPERPNIMEKEKLAELRESYLTSMKEYVTTTRPNNPDFGKNMLSLLSHISDIGNQHSLLLNMYRADVRKLSVSPVITELFDLHPPSAYKEC